MGEGTAVEKAAGAENVSVLLPMIRLLLFPSEMGVPDIVTAPPGVRTLLPTRMPEPIGSTTMG